MHSNVIAFTARPKTTTSCPAPRRPRDNVITLASWIGRAMPRRTPTGVFFTTQVLVTTGEIS
jgi:hypothetical protein